MINSYLRVGGTATGMKTCFVSLNNLKVVPKCTTVNEHNHTCLCDYSSMSCT